MNRQTKQAIAFLGFGSEVFVQGIALVAIYAADCHYKAKEWAAMVIVLAMLFSAVRVMLWEGE